MAKENCAAANVSEDLIVNVKTSRRPRFKPGAELSGKVTIMDVHVHEESTEDYEEMAVQLRLTKERIQATH